MNEATIKISKALQPIAQAIDETIAHIAGERIGFTLIVYTAGRASYISTVERATSIAEIKKLLALWEGGMPDIPAHSVS